MRNDGTADRGARFRRRPLGPALLALATAALVPATASLATPDYAAERAEMVRTIASVYAHETEVALKGRQIRPSVLDALRTVPRHEFVPEALRGESYADRPLPIGYGQTISQPYIVALMTDLLEVGPDSVVLEVGTGSGYQAAVLAHLVRRAHSIELIGPLAASAAERLARLGYANASVRHGDGYNGLPDAAPFDGIIVTAAAGHVPPPLLQQLRPGGRMVIPLGPPLGMQHLTVIEHDPAGRIRTRQLFPVRFVPLNRE